MAELFLIADTHFGHKNILTFKREGGAWLRPFKSLTEMHVTMIDRWNSVVGPKDVVYHLGDVAFTAEGLALVGMLNGRKRLVKGNHDLLKLNLYRKYFVEIYGVRQIDRYWFTHIPMHDGSTARSNCLGNIHGHLHDQVEPSPKHLNVSVERIDYTPMSFDLAKSILESRRES